MRVRLLGLKNNGMAKFWNRCQCLYFCDYAMRFHFGNRIALRCRRLKIACVKGSWKGLLRNLWLDFVSHHRSREQSKQKLALIRAYVICQRRKDFLYLGQKRSRWSSDQGPKIDPAWARSRPSAREAPASPWPLASTGRSGSLRLGCRTMDASLPLSSMKSISQVNYLFTELLAQVIDHWT